MESDMAFEGPGIISSYVDCKPRVLNGMHIQADETGTKTDIFAALHQHNFDVICIVGM